MKYNVTIREKTYTVEIEDINARPVIALVDGIRFEVMPENGIQAQIKKAAHETKAVAEKGPSSSISASASSPALNPVLTTTALTAPLPGTVTEVFVKMGDVIEAGKVVLIIEAMKMKNSIRSVRAGKIAEVLVNAGQTVAHKQTLVKFQE